MQRVISTHLFVKHRLTTVWLERVWDAGFPAVEIFCARQHIDYRDKSQITELGHWFRDSELKVHSLHAPMYNDDVWGRSGPQAVIDITETAKGKRIAVVDEIKRAIEIADVVPFRYLIQHLGVTGEEFDERRLESAFSSLDELKVFAGQRGVEVLLENTPNELSSGERLNYFLSQTHLNLHYCFDVGHAHMARGIEAEFEEMKERIRSTHIHDNDGEEDQHLFPEEGTIDWRNTMRLLGSRRDQYPLLLELREQPDHEHPIEQARQAMEELTKHL
ncbi:MAG: sugar phosphate isomerase/epimerase [Acidobacteriaceae bacterium]|nr:sugar phosphate isomerase/epimerase [Acidobacteriaceae bacterium]MBV9779165.1 sugar phosphate isomerase/epimerase [Acidobacteriaceae bacterium]